MYEVGKRPGRSRMSASLFAAKSVAACRQFCVGRKPHAPLFRYLWRRLHLLYVRTYCNGHWGRGPIGYKQWSVLNRDAVESVQAVQRCRSAIRERIPPLLSGGQWTTRWWSLVDYGGLAGRLPHATGTRGIQIKCSAINAMMSLFCLLSVAQSEQCNLFFDNLKNYTINPRTAPFLLFFGEQKQVNCLVDRILRCSMY